MRFSLAAVSVAISVALLAGCSSSTQGVSALPGASSSQPMAGQRHGIQPGDVRGKMTLLRALKLQLAGKIPSPATPKTLRQIIKTLESKSHPNFKYHPGGKVGVWALNEAYGYLLGMSSNLKKTTMAISLSSSGCGYYPTTAKTDSNHNVWVACDYNTTFNGGTVQEFSKTGSVVGTYTWTVSCPSPSQYNCYEAFGNGWDSGESSTTVYAANNSSALFYCQISYPYYCYGSSSAGYYYWPKGSPSASSTSVNLYSTRDSANDTIYSIGYLDSDANNNLYFTFYGCENVSPYTCGDGIDVLANANSATVGTPTTLVAPGGIAFWGGTYVNGAQNQLSSIDQVSRNINLYTLPGGSSAGFMGPTVQNAFGLGDPIQGNINKTSSKMIIGDGAGWFDSGAIGSNTWKGLGNINCTGGCFGTAYASSDRTW